MVCALAGPLRILKVLPRKFATSYPAAQSAAEFYRDEPPAFLAP